MRDHRSRNGIPLSRWVTAWQRLTRETTYPQQEIRSTARWPGAAEVSAVVTTVGTRVSALAPKSALANVLTLECSSEYEAVTQGRLAPGI